MAYTKQQATDAIAALDLDNLTSSQIENELKSIISQLSVEQKAKYGVSSNAKTVLYSGYDVSGLKNDPAVRLLDKTEAFEFLNDAKNNEALIEALTKAYGETPNFKDYNSPAGQFIGGIDGDPRTPGAWDTISKKFVSETEGEVTTLVGEKAGTDRVFFQTELDALKNNPDVTSINGTPTDEFKTSITDMNNEETINKFKTDTEARRIVSTQPDGTLDTNKLTSLSQSDIKEAIVKDPIKSNALSTYESDLDAKTKVAKANGMSYDEMMSKTNSESDKIVKDFMQSDDVSLKDVQNDINAKKLDLYVLTFYFSKKQTQSLTIKDRKTVLTCKYFKANKSLHVRNEIKQKGARYGTEQKVA